MDALVGFLVAVTVRVCLQRTTCDYLLSCSGACKTLGVRLYSLYV
jgi:hypothetical protein